MEDELTVDERVVARRVREFSRERILPHVAGRRQPTVDCALFREAADLGVTRLLLPREVGGLGFTHVASARVFEDIAQVSFPFGFSLFVQHNVISGIARYGSPNQVQRFVPSLLSGDRLGAFCLTEPAVGSDAAAITTAASKSGSGWELCGEKSWVTNGARAQVYSIYAQTDPAAGWRGIACFIVELDTTPGMSRTPAYSMLGADAMAVCGIRLDHCPLDADSLLVPPGTGFKAAMAGINRARAIIAAMCCGMLDASLQTALNYCVNRRAFGKAVAEFQGLQFELAEVATDLAAARLLAYRAAHLLDEGDSAMVEAAHAKKFATRVALRGISTCMRAMGANGLLDDYRLGDHLASAQMSQYLDGTDEIQNLVIARALLATAGFVALSSG